MKSAINNLTRRGAPPFVALLEFIVGAYLGASLLPSAGADLLLRT
jgi:xanthosine utilization system XapX-like protein